MKPLPPDFLQFHFRKKTVRGRGEITLDREMYQLFFAIDDTKPMSRVVRESGLHAKKARDVLIRLLALDLIEIKERGGGFAGREFIEALRTHFIKAIGPLGSFLLEEALPVDLQSINALSAGDASELVLRLSNEIPDPGQRKAFKKAMITHIVETES